MKAELKELPLEFVGRGEAKGFKFKQLQKSDSAYLYQINLPYGSRGPHYEVFKRVVNNRFNQVSYPTARHFGAWAWTTSNQKKAEAIFAELSGSARR